MTEGTEMDKGLALLSKRIEDQSRFTRSVVVICTLLILGINFYTSTTMIGVLPQLFVTNIMGNMEPLVQQFNLVESSVHKKHQSP